jgi:sugar lactone lactonase YvrE
MSRSPTRRGGGAPIALPARYAWIRRVLGAALVIACGCADPAPRGPCTATPPIGTVCGFENPEDIEFIESAAVIAASNMRFDGRDPEGVVRGGFLSLLDPTTGAVRRAWPTAPTMTGAAIPGIGDPICGAPPAGALYPHGLVSARRDGATLVYVVGHRGEHGGREAVEIFAASGSADATVLRWSGCIPIPPAMMGNDVAIAPDGEVVVSNYQPSPSLWYTVEANLFGMNTGDLRAWSPGRGWRTIPDTASRMPNGVAVSPDGAVVYYSETASGRVHRRARLSGADHASVVIGGNPDGMAWSPRGTLLVATHTAGASLLGCAFGRSPCRTGWEIYEIDPTTLATTLLLAHDGMALGAASSPIAAAGRLYLGSIWDDRIGVAPLGGS